MYKISKRRYEKDDNQEIQIVKNKLLELRRFVSDKTDPNYYLRLTTRPYLAINPSFQKANIFGIYAFPFTRLHYLKLLNKDIQFLSKYIMVFSPKDKSKVLNKYHYSMERFVSDMETIMNLYFPDIERKDEFYKIIKECYKDFDNPRFFLMLTENLKPILPNIAQDKLYNSNKIFRDLGYTGIYNGIEAVFFSTSCLNDPWIIENNDFIKPL